MRERGEAMVLPMVTALAAVALYPVVLVFWYSLQRKLPVTGVSEFIGLENFQRLLAEPRFATALGNTVYFTIVSVGLELLFGLAVALLLDRAFRARGLLRAVVLIPWAVPTVVSARMWEWMYNSDFGVLNYVLGARINWLGDPAWAMHAAIFMEVWKTTPFVALLLLAGLQVIPRELYASARLDGARGWTVFRRITLPLLLPTIIVVLLFRTLDAFRVFDAIYVLTGGGPANATETLSIYAYKTLFQTLQFGYGSAIAVMVFVGVGLISVLYIRILARQVQA